jgi:hypothetical protein
MFFLFFQITFKKNISIDKDKAKFILSLERWFSSVNFLPYIDGRQQ